MENFIFEKNKGAITKLDLLYSGLYALLIAIMIVFGYVLLFSVELAHCNMVRLVVSFFIILIVSWVVLLIMGVVGMLITYIYNRLIVKVLFKEYPEEQFLMEYGMMTGTASTATILLRELDPDFKAPAAENMVYQNFPAIVFGFPMMLLATLAPVQPLLCLLIFIGFFAVMNVILFRRQIFLRKKK